MAIGLDREARLYILLLLTGYLFLITEVICKIFSFYRRAFVAWLGLIRFWTIVRVARWFMTHLDHAFDPLPEVYYDDEGHIEEAPKGWFDTIASLMFRCFASIVCFLCGRPLSFVLNVTGLGLLMNVWWYFVSIFYDFFCPHPDSGFLNKIYDISPDVRFDDARALSGQSENDPEADDDEFIAEEEEDADSEQDALAATWAMDDATADTMATDAEFDATVDFNLEEEAIIQYLTLLSRRRPAKAPARFYMPKSLLADPSLNGKRRSFSLMRFLFPKRKPRWDEGYINHVRHKFGKSPSLRREVLMSELNKTPEARKLQVEAVQMKYPSKLHIDVVRASHLEFYGY